TFQRPPSWAESSRESWYPCIGRSFRSPRIASSSMLPLSRYIALVYRTDICLPRRPRRVQPRSRRRRSGISGAPGVRDVVGHGDAFEQVRGRFGLPGPRDEREDARPQGQPEVLLVVLGGSGAHLRGRLVDRDREQDRLTEFLGGRHPCLVLTARQHVPG